MPRSELSLTPTNAAPQKEKPADILVFISSKDSTCNECGNDLGRHAWITLRKDKGALCLACADMDHLEFLGRGDAALTRRARKYSTLAAIVLKWSSARKRYERQGLLVERDAIDRAEQECLADADIRRSRQARASERREELDRDYVSKFAARILEVFPRCPQGLAQEIAEHACRKYSDRIGRSAAAKAFDEEAVRLAVGAHIRHRETNYDTLLMRGVDRATARERVLDKVRDVMRNWGPNG